MNRRTFIATSSFGGLIPTAMAVAKESQLPKPFDLRILGTFTTQKVRPSSTPHNPIVLLASLPGCPYCELVRRNYLIPYQIEQKLHSWQLDTADYSQLIDFEGKNTTPAAWLKSMRIKITPTVLFLNGKGDEIASRLEGVAVPDFYGAYLDERLIAARQKL
jgi:thioredoxin-related protein